MPKKKFLFIFFVILFAFVFLVPTKYVFAEKTVADCKEKCADTYETDLAACKNMYGGFFGFFTRNKLKECQEKAQADQKTCRNKCDSDSNTSGTNTAPVGTTPITNPTGSASATANAIVNSLDNSDFSSTMTPPNLPTYGPSSWPAVGKKIMDFMGWIAGTIFVGVLFIGAVMYIVAGTNEQSAETGKKAIYAAIIGIAITALAWTIVSFVAGLIK